MNANAPIVSTWIEEASRLVCHGLKTKRNDGTDIEMYFIVKDALIEAGIHKVIEAWAKNRKARK